MLCRHTSPTPAGAPAGRAVLNRPATYTVLPTTTCAHATPLICAVGSGSAVTVTGVVGFAGSSGAESARATLGARTARPPASRSVLTSPARSLLSAAVDLECMGVPPSCPRRPSPEPDDEH